MDHQLPAHLTEKWFKFPKPHTGASSQNVDVMWLVLLESPHRAEKDKQVLKSINATDANDHRFDKKNVVSTDSIHFKNEWEKYLQMTIVYIWKLTVMLKLWYVLF